MRTYLTLTPKFPFLGSRLPIVWSTGRVRVNKLWRFHSLLALELVAIFEEYFAERVVLLHGVFVVDRFLWSIEVRGLWDHRIIIGKKEGGVALFLRGLNLRVQKSWQHCGLHLTDQQWGLLMLKLLLLVILLFLLLFQFHFKATATFDFCFGGSVHEGLKTFLFYCTQIFIDFIIVAIVCIKVFIFF